MFGPAFLCVFFAALLSRTAAEDVVVIYDDYLQEGFSDWSWAPVNWAATTQVYEGDYSIDFMYYGYKGLYVKANSGEISMNKHLLTS